MLNFKAISIWLKFHTFNKNLKITAYEQINCIFSKSKIIFNSKRFCNAIYVYRM
jgi:hypothetical protein